jgi:CHAT domain-containing protein/uncharacterized protein HemY
MKVNKTQKLATVISLLLPFTNTGAVFASLSQNTLEVVQAPVLNRNNTVQANQLLERGNKHLDNRQYALALEAFQQALAIFKQTKDRQGEGKALLGLGNTYINLNQTNKAIEVYQQSIAIAKLIKDRELEGKSLSGLGTVYKDLKKFSEAFKLQQTALNIANEIKNYELESNALRRLGHIDFEQNNYRKAINYYQQSLHVAQRINNSKLQGDAIGSLATGYEKLKDYPKAVSYYQKLLELAKKTNNSTDERRALFLLGEVHIIGWKDFSKALNYFEQALSIAQEAKDKDMETLLLVSIGGTLSALRNENRAISYYQQALKVAQESKNKNFETISLINLANLVIRQGNIKQGAEFTQQALKLAQETKNRAVEGVALGLLGAAYNVTDNLPKSIEVLEKALIISKETQDLQLQAMVLANLGSAYLMRGDTSKALELSQQALAIATGKHGDIKGQTINNSSYEGLSLIILGAAYASGKSDYQQALVYLQQGLSVVKANKQRYLEAFALYGLSLTYHSLTEYPKAIDYAKQSLAIAQEIKNPLVESIALISVGMNYDTLGNYQKAISYYQQGLTISRKNKIRSQEGAFLLLIANINHKQGNTQKSIELTQQALPAFEQSKSPLLKGVALLYLSYNYDTLKNYNKTIATLEESLALFKNLNNRELEAHALTGLGYFYRKSGQYQQAISFYQQALAAHPNPELPGSGSDAKIGLARVYRSLNKPTIAIAYYKQAVSGVEKVRQNIKGLPPELQLSFLQAGREDEKIADAYRELANLLLTQGRVAEAQQVLELLKVEELRDFSQKPSKTTVKIPLNSVEEQIRKENGTLIAFGKKIDECQQKNCNQLNQLLDRREDLTKQFNDNIQNIEKQVGSRPLQDQGYFNPKDFGRKAQEIFEAQPNTVLIYPLVLENKIWLLWASKGGIKKAIEVPVQQTKLEATVKKFRSLLQQPSSDINLVKSTGKELYDWLIKPIEPELKKNQVKNLVLSLDRATRYIPISALYDGKNYLIENYTVSTILSADLTDTKDRLPLTKQSTNILGLGLSEAKSGFDALPNVPLELDAIIKQTKADNKGIYPGEKFLNNAFDFRTLRNNLRGKEIVHIATHALFQAGGSENSFLVLGTGEKLTISQIQTLQDLANIHLVVLSACETGLGEKGKDGIEINAISYYFLNSGVKAVLASLWSVSDISTSNLMREFYNNLANNSQTTKAQALREAQLTLLHSKNAQFSHPFHWAPFILTGNGL